MTTPRCALAIVLMLATVTPRAQNYEPSPDLESLHVPFDALLDLHVRDGLVYYRALQGDRARLNRYLASLNEPAMASGYASWDKDRQKAFWINAYNAFVLQTVINHYPILGGAKAFPPNSIRQIPGAFERMPHMAAGRSVTLDQIETSILAEFKDPRVFLVLGRGAVGSGRLRSEAFGVKSVDALAGRVSISPILSWRAPAFIEEYADDSFDLPKREPIERAVIGFLRPQLLDAEVDFIRKNGFQLTYLPFDWRLNDLTGGRPD